MAAACADCGEPKTEEEAAAKSPCKKCGSIKTNQVIEMEAGHFKLTGHDVTVLAFQKARLRALYREMELDELRAVCEGGKSALRDVPEANHLDAIGIAKHIYDERTGRQEWKKPLNLVHIAMTAIAVLISGIALYKSW